MDILLIHPPAAKAAEPPLGTAILLGHLKGAGIEAGAIDANLEAYLRFFDEERLAAAAGQAPPTPLYRAIRNIHRSLALLRSPAAAKSLPRYRTAVHHLGRALGAYGGQEERLTLGDYVHETLSEFAPDHLERLSSGSASTLFHDYFESSLLPQVEKLAPRIVSLSVNYRHQILPAFELAGMLKRRLPSLMVVGGGGVFTSWKEVLTESALRFSAFDRIVFGPGEGPLLDLVSGRGGEDYFLENSSSVAFFPDYSFAPLGDYLSPLPVLQVSASRGCYWSRCLFCPEASSPTHPYAAHPYSAFPDMLLELSRIQGANHFHITDNAVPVAALRALVRRKGDLGGISWHGFVRFEKALLDKELVRGMSESGCRMLQLGLESGSQRVLDRLEKGTRLEEAARILANLKEAGIATYVYILLGTPGETENDAEATLEFLEKHRDLIGFLNLAIMNLPSRSDLLDRPEEYGIASAAPLNAEEPLGLYHGFEPAEGWDRVAARRFLKDRLLGSQIIREIVGRTPPFFTSNHAFLFRPGAP